MFMLVGKGAGSSDYTHSDLRGLGYQLIVHPTTPFLAMYETLCRSYSAMITGKDDALVSAAGGYAALQAKVHETIDLEKLLRAERHSVENDQRPHK